MAPPSSSDFAHVYNQYVSNLKPAKRRFIQDIEIQSGNATLPDIQNSIQHLVDNVSKGKFRGRLHKYVMPVVEALKGYSQAVDQMVAAYPTPSALVWGGLRCVIEILLRFEGLLESAQSVLESLEEHIWALESCDKLYSSSPHCAPTVQRVVARSYTHIIDLWYRIFKEFNRSQVSQFSRAIMPKKKFEKALDAIKKDAAQLEMTCNNAERTLQDGSRQIIEELSATSRSEQELQIIERAAAQVEREALERHRRETKAELKSIQSQIDRREHQQLIEAIGGDSSYSADKLFDMQQERFPNTCQWIFETPVWQQWTSKSSPTPIIWLYGKHGCGKSFIWAASIQRIRATEGVFVAFLLISSDREASQQQLLRSLAYQMVDFLQSQEGGIGSATVDLLTQCKNGDVLEKLISCALKEIAEVYIFIDGLDEISTSKAPGLKRLIHFLVKETIQHRDRVRLWFSSQYSPDTKRTIYDAAPHSTVELAVERSHTEEDIARFLDQKLSDSTKRADRLARLIVKVAVNTEVQGSFLWAVKMVEELGSTAAEDNDDMVMLAKRALPTSLHDVYRIKVESYRKKHTLRRELPLWKVILSLLTFAKRPLRILEIQEAIETIRAKELSNITTEVIIEACPLLTHYIRSRDGDANGTLVLSHHSVRAFLQSHASDSLGVPCVHEDCHEQNIVDTDLLARCCMRYLLRSCFASLLQQNKEFQSIDCDGKLLRERQFATYAAKYWYRHCDMPSPSPKIQNLVKEFLLSDNFHTSLQIQSICIIGHFLIDYHPLTGRPRLMKQNLPRWTNQIDDKIHHFQSQYRSFFVEWHHVLQLGLSSHFVGEIDRVLWPTLGAGTFLRGGQCRYSCFTVGAGSDTANPAFPHDSATSCLVIASSNDGRRQTLCFADDNGAEDIRIRTETWVLSGTDGAQLYSERFVSVNKCDSLYRKFGARHQQRLALIPKTLRAPLQNSVRLQLEGKLLHVGCHSYILNGAGDERRYQILDFKDAVSGDSCFEEACQQGSIVILARRRRLKSTDEDLPTKRAEHSARMRRFHDINMRHSARYQPDSDSEEEYFGDSDEDLECQLDSQTSSLADAAELESRSESDGSLLGYQSISETGSAASDLISRSSDDGRDVQQIQSEGSATDGFQEVETETEDEMSSLMSATSRRFSESASGSIESLSPSVHSDADQQDDGEHFSYPVTISAGRTNFVNCDGCPSFNLETWYHCPVCEPGTGFDLCTECLEKSFWCYDQAHPLYECGRRGVKGVIGWSTYLLRQDLRVFDLAEGSPKELFNWQGRQQDMLHESPPILAPNAKLLVWPVGQESLLFANYGTRRSQMHTLRSSSRKARQLSMALQFTSCGRYLHVAHMEALRLLESRRSTKRRNPHAYALTFVLTTFRIASEPCSHRRPERVSRLSHSLETPEKPFSPSVPYTWTWTATDVYVCLSGSTLRVYKIPLAQPESEVAYAATITTPTEKVFLPRSAQDRTVQFFPPSGPGAPSTVIVGPHYGVKTALPICIYLQEKDLGRWINAQDEDHTNALKRLKRRAAGDFEPFDSDDDCDLIPMDMDE